ncbi:MAG TPA: PilX N-terminal domain-containing pilus assembly protein [Woeseiaceae bacterium]|nr:PilX N-terminal domain-containing pilus assembly protein [Woeseiaceae bacterium]
MHHRQLNRGRESGAALIVALIFLLLMTLLSTSSMRVSTMQERMAGNQRDWNVGFQRAEAGLRGAEEYLLDTDDLPDFDGTGGLYQINADNRPKWTTIPADPGNGSVAYPTEAAPEYRYYIEKLSSIRPAGTSTETGTEVEETYYFRITAVGYGLATDNVGDSLTSVVLSSVYRSR